jgi:predicted nucleotide-binding protein
MAKMNKQQAIELLERQLSQIDGLLSLDGEAPAFKKWRRETLTAIRYVFDEQSLNVKEFNDIAFWYPDGPFMAFTKELAEAERHERIAQHRKEYTDGLDEARHRIQDMLTEIRTYWPDQNVATHQSAKVSALTRDVFIVHGHDEALKIQVARFLERLDLNPIILHEQPDQGRTIIEKFHDYASVSFCIALFTPDDLSENKPKVKSLDDLKPRARQNVVFEFGFFVGRLGRKSAVALVKRGVEMLSDFGGVLFIPADNETTWQMALVRELKAVGFDVDANRIFR